ncbi:MAG: tRNA-dihydrouridine synthase B [Saliniramus fredricksonii]|uniref:tRNA-dihydrouridine synthase n=1 Tax=Saliniramus fredricksonii TaxID=1653334 RepID=A0A0P7X7U5_9HYPH|nr:tRNA dihydrouridine synthase DusB [Saliniramus fredricksonii]KPQ11184.1 MAG: tRNA-dihydrouridine synthase B [Saliniramus fredricksonii]SCC81714.1 putative TIM-barrel protein, nifR3 family [Saliniramus fredricksonii]
MRIGNVEIAGRVALAPMSGVTDIHARRIASRFGAAMVVCEMVASEAYVHGAEEARIRAEGQGIDPHIVQLAGCRAGWMADAARMAQDTGADIVDINMGCPAKHVSGGMAGSALMRDLDHACGLIEAVVGAVEVPVTVKMRLGWDHAHINAPELARRAESLGVAAITVHGRTRQQFYKGEADWPAIAAVRAATTLPLIANGDICDADDARAALAASGADAVMVGRATLGKPWLIARIEAQLAGLPWAEPDMATKTAAISEHYEGLLSLYGHRVGIRHARKHLAAFADHAAEEGHALAPDARRELVTTTEPARVLALLHSIVNAPEKIGAAA